MNNRHALWITWVLLILIIVIGSVRIFIELRQQDIIKTDITRQIKAEVSEKIKSIKQPVDGSNGYTPIKGIDYFDGINGKDGADGINGTDGVDGKDGQDGVSGLTPELKCNILKNRWEVRYTPDESWQVLNGEVVPCVGGV